MSKIQKSLGILLLLSLGGQQAVLASGSHNLLKSITSQTDRSPIPWQIAQQNELVIFVSPSGTDIPGAGTQAQPLRTITAAIASSPQPGTVIQLAPGNYTTDAGEVFPLKLPQGVKLRGDRSTKGANTTISGGGLFISPTFARQNIAILASNNAAVEGLTITNSNPRGYGLWVESSQNVAIANNTFKGTTHDGVFLTGSANATVVANVFTKNRASGISAVGTSSGEIRGNELNDTGFGLSIGQRSTVALISNRIINNVQGIVMSDAVAPTLRGNLITNNVGDGLVLLKTRNGVPTPDLGTAANPGQNIIKNNKKQDITNASGATLLAVGNDIDKKRVTGPIELVASNVPITPPPTSGTLSDIRGHWAEQYVASLAARGVIGGFSDGTFRPDEPVTRAQFATILNKAFPDKPAIRVSSIYKDVAPNFWATAAIKQADAKGFMSGYTGGTFRPSENIPRVQVWVSLVNGWKMENGGGDLPRLFTDAVQIPVWAVKAVDAAVKNGLIVNYPDRAILAPNRKATRAEVAAIVYQTLVSRGNATPIPSNYIIKQ